MLFARIPLKIVGVLMVMCSLRNSMLILKYNNHITHMNIAHSQSKKGSMVIAWVAPTGEVKQAIATTDYHYGG